MRSRHVTLALLLSATGLLGCGGDAPQSFAVPLEQFPDRMAQAICAQNFKCCSAADINGRTMNKCVEDNSALFSLTASGISSGQTNGRITYDAAQMGNCLTATEAMSCEDWKKGLTGADQNPACKAALIGRVPLGGACDQDDECAAGICEGANSGAIPPTEGRCTATAAAGASCGAGVSCADGFTCQPGTQVCVAKKQGGESCNTNEECINGCNLQTHLCSCYVGCAVASPVTPSTAVVWLALLGTAVLGLRFGRRRRPGR